MDQVKVPSISTCEFCGKTDLSVSCILPISRDGRLLDAISCVDCAVGQGLYCVKHQRPHFNFGRGATACLACIGEISTKEAPEAERLYLRVISSLSTDRARELGPVLDLMTKASGTSVEGSLLHLLVLRSLVTRSTVEAVVLEVEKIGSADELFDLGPLAD